MQPPGYISDPDAYPDKSADWYAYYESRREAELNQLLDDHPEIIAEHEDNPFGYRRHPSPYLQRLHNYFRLRRTLGKYYILSDDWGDYQIARVEDWGQPPTIYDETYASEEASMHGVFMKRIDDLRGAR